MISITLQQWFSNIMDIIIHIHFGCLMETCRMVKGVWQAVVFVNYCIMVISRTLVITVHWSKSIYKVSNI